MIEEEEINNNDENKNINENPIKNNINKNNVIKDSEQNEKKEKEPKKLNKIKIKSDNLKVFEKYHNLSIKELHILLLQKNDDLIKLNEEKEKSKKTLNNLIAKLNNTISSNSEFLYDDIIDDELILNLKKIKEDKKRQLENSKKINNLFKEQLLKINNKILYNEKVKKKYNLIDNKIDNLKKKNKFLKKEINEIKSKKVIQDKELEIISDNKKYPLKIKIKTEEMNNFSSQKHDYFSKLSMSMKSLDNIIKEIKRFDEMYNKSIKEDTDENIVKKINFWMKLIKSDLSGDNNEILNRIENEQSQFLNEIKNRNETIINNSNYNTIGNETNTITNSAYNNNTEESFPKKQIMKMIYLKIAKNKIIINKNKSSSLLYSNYNKSANNSINKRKIPSPVNSDYNLDDKKTLFKKLNYLKFKSPPIGMKIILRNINNLENNYKGNNFLISEEINESVEANTYNLNNKYMNLNSINNNSNNQELNYILSKDYNEISDSEYRELLNKKEQYLESNLRLEKNINDIKKTKNKKISNILRVVKENENNLENIKKQNSLIEKEINNLYNVFLLTVEQAKLKNEINQKKFNKKKYKLKTESVKNEENKLFKSSDKIIKRKNLEDIIIPKKREIKIIEDKNIKKKTKKENRDEQLKLIKEKYRDENIILNEDNQTNEFEKDNNEYGDTFINKNENKENSINELNNEVNNEIKNDEINLNEKNNIDENNYEKEDILY